MNNVSNLDKENQKTTRGNYLDLLFAPVSCLTRISPLIILISIIILSAVLLTGYYTINTDFLGLIGFDFSEYSILGAYSGFQKGEEESWQISYELDYNTTFQGLVRQVFPIRERLFPILTHDILITSGDFANRDLVKVSVFNHHFSWTTSKSTPLQGKINLLHAIPANDDIYQKLLKIKNGDSVIISGREILRIDALRNEKVLGWWEDDGCNTLLVTQVDFIK